MSLGPGPNVTAPEMISSLSRGSAIWIGGQ